MSAWRTRAASRRSELQETPGISSPITRQTRAASRREESLEPQESVTTRQTRTSSRRLESRDHHEGGSVARKRKSGSKRQDIPQRGARRGPRRSVENVVIQDLPSSSPAVASSEHPKPSPKLREPELIKDMAATSADNHYDEESQSGSEEDKAARLQDLLDFDLPKLHRWCEKAYNALTSFAYSEPATEEARKSINAVAKQFKTACRPLNEDGTTYIDLSFSDLPYRDDPTAYAAIQKGMRSANLISLLLSLVDVKFSRKAVLDFLQEIDAKFITFMDIVQPTQRESSELAFFIRCCRLVELLRKAPETSPLVLASGVFCKQAANTPEEAAQSLSQGPFRSLCGLEEGDSSAFFETLKSNLEAVTDLLFLPERSEIESHLDTQFPQEELFEELWTWALNMYMHVTKTAVESEVTSSGQEKGEVEGTTRAELEGFYHGENGQQEEEESSDSDSTSEEEYDQLQTTVSKVKSFIQDDATLHAVRRSEGSGLKRRAVDQPHSQGSDMEDIESPSIVEAIRKLDAAVILGLPSPLNASVSGSPTSENGRIQSSRRRRRSRSSSQDFQGKSDHEGEDDFEVNNRLIDESMRVQIDDSDTPPVARKRRRLSGGPRRPTGRPAPRDDRANRQVREIERDRTNQAARTHRVANKPKPKPRQTREKWSEADTFHLLGLIADKSLNCSWSAMEREGGFDIPRNQQAIRDKARNLKKAYLCADANLPPGFDYVYLSKKERDEVIAAGYNPDRTENDVDDDDRVVNNIWYEE